jgi:hypothetical protein
MRKWILVSLLLCAGSLYLSGQAKPPESAAANPAANRYSGMYSFLEEGEFVQVSVEDAGRVTGFISRYGEQPSDRGAFLDQFFKEGKLQGKSLTFTTETVHAVWYEFKGSVERGEGKTPQEEAYYVLQGTLTEYVTDVNKKTTSKAREVRFKAFPQDDSATPTARN